MLSVSEEKKHSVILNRVKKLSNQSTAPQQILRFAQDDKRGGSG